MTFDLYGTVNTVSATDPAPTTLDALQAAEWVQLDNGHWQLQWRDHTDYDADGGVADNTGTFTCVLFPVRKNEWFADCCHSHRGGEESHDLECPGVYVIDAMEAAREAMVKMVTRWEQGIEEYLRNLQTEGDDE